MWRDKRAPEAKRPKNSYFCNLTVFKPHKVLKIRANGVPERQGAQKTHAGSARTRAYALKQQTINSALRRASWQNPTRDHERTRRQAFCARVGANKMGL